MNPQTQPSSTRLVFLDWVRILAFGWLVLYHVGMYYVTWPWHIKSPHASHWLEPWMRLSSSWRMDLMFLVSGVATSMMLLRDGASTALLRRCAARLFWPLVFGVLLVVPLQSWREVVFRYGYQGSFADFTPLYFGGYGGFCAAPGACLILPTWNHLWFLPYLLVYTLLLWLLLRRWPGLLVSAVAWLSRRLNVLTLLLVPVAWLACARWFLQSRFPQTHALVDDWFAHSIFFAAFAAGALLARVGSVWSRFADWRWPALITALLAWLLLMGAAPAWGVLSSLPVEVARLLLAVQQWSAIVAMLGFASLHLRANGRARRYLTEAVFPVYILHQTLIIAFAWQLSAYDLPPALEALLLVVLTMGLSFAVFELVRRSRMLRPLFGLQGAAA